MIYNFDQFLNEGAVKEKTHEIIDKVVANLGSKNCGGDCEEFINANFSELLGGLTDDEKKFAEGNKEYIIQAATSMVEEQSKD